MILLYLSFAEYFASGLLLIAMFYYYHFDRLNLLAQGLNLLGSEYSAVFALGRNFLGPNLLPPVYS